MDKIDTNEMPLYIPATTVSGGEIIPSSKNPSANVKLGIIIQEVSAIIEEVKKTRLNNQ